MQVTAIVCVVLAGVDTPGSELKAVMPRLKSTSLSAGGVSVSVDSCAAVTEAIPLTTVIEPPLQSSFAFAGMPLI